MELVESRMEQNRATPCTDHGWKNAIRANKQMETLTEIEHPIFLLSLVSWLQSKSDASTL